MRRISQFFFIVEKIAAAPPPPPRPLLSSRYSNMIGCLYFGGRISRPTLDEQI